MASDFSSILAQMAFYNVDSESGVLALGQVTNQFQGANPGLTLSSYFNVLAPSKLGTTPDALRLGNVVLFNRFMQAELTDDTDVLREEAGRQLWHEFWHVATGLDDLQLVNEFIASGARLGSLDASVVFNNWLQSGCDQN